MIAAAKDKSERNTEVLRLFRAGMSIHAVSLRVGIHWMTVKTIVDEHFDGPRCPHCRRSMVQRCPSCGAKVNEWPADSDVCFACLARGQSDG